MKILYNFSDFLIEGAPTIKMDDAIDLIKKKCEKLRYEFLGFVDNKWLGDATKLILKCDKHNHTWETSTLKNFKRDKSRCKFCGKESMAKLQYVPEEIAIQKIKQKCQEEDYEFLGFVDNIWKGKNTYLILKCKIHGVWDTTIYESFMIGRGCPECGKEISRNSKRLPEETAKINVINKCKEKGYEFLGFSGEKYINNTTKLILNCLKPNHGKWYTATYNGLMSGIGCPICSESKGANEVGKVLEKYGFKNLKIGEEKLDNIKYYSREYTFDECKGTQKSKFSRKLPFDFYVYDYNLCIEYDGRQHFEPAFGTINLEITKENDQIKNNYCNGENGRPKILRIPYTDFKNIESIIVNELKLN
jgi:hypothetical protein